MHFLQVTQKWIENSFLILSLDTKTKVHNKKPTIQLDGIKMNDWLLMINGFNVKISNSDLTQTKLLVSGKPVKSIVDFATNNKVPLSEPITGTFANIYILNSTFQHLFCVNVNLTIVNSNFKSKFQHPSLIDARNCDIKVLNCTFPNVMRMVKTENFDDYNQATIKVTFSNTTIENSVFSSNKANHSIVGIIYSNLVMRNCSFEKNVGVFGGAISILKGSAQLTDSTFKDNIALQGGVIHIRGPGFLSIKNAKFVGNKAVDSRIISVIPNMILGTGGVIYSDSTLNVSIEIYSSQFNDNKGKFVGGVLSVSRTILLISNSSFRNNSSPSGFVLYAQVKSQVRIHATHFDHNHALENPNSNYPFKGGAIFCAQNTSIEIENSTFSKNTGGVYGGVINIMSYSVIHIISSIFHQNSATYGGVLHTQNYVRLHMENSTCSANVALSSGGAISASTMIQLMIIDSKFNNNTSHKAGGAVRVISDIMATILRTSFKHNSAFNGGSLYASRNVIVSLKNTSILNSTGSNGGALRAHDNVTVISKSCHFMENSADFGACMALSEYTSVQVVSSIFNSNVGHIRGIVHASLDFSYKWQRIRRAFINISDCVFQHNTGSVMFISGPFYVTIRTSQFIQNLDGYNDGAVIYSERRTNIYISFCAFIQNSCAGSGGAIQISGNLTVSESTFIGNSAGAKGGAIHHMNDDTAIRSNSKIVSSTFKDNIAGDAGAAVYLQENIDAAVAKCTFLNNTAYFDSNIHLYEIRCIRMSQCTFFISPETTKPSIYFSSDNSFFVEYKTFQVILSTRNGTFRSSSSQFWEEATSSRMVYMLSSSWRNITIRQQETVFASGSTPNFLETLFLNTLR